MQKVSLIPHELPYDVNEEIKYLRANIQFFGTEKKVILFTSILTGEGKSTCVLNLAKSLADQGKRVLLMDCDLRRSTLRQKITNKELGRVGMSAYLSGQSAFEDVLCNTDEPVMYLLFAGSVPPNPAELLSTKRMVTLLKWAREQFDYVLVDTAPLGTVSDAALLAPMCDGSVLVVEADKVPYRAAQRVVQQLENAGCAPMGVVLNKVNYASGSRYYNHYCRKYSYGYEYSPKETKKK